MDISKCSGNGCPMSVSCLRVSMPPHPYTQTWFVRPPIFNNQCELYIYDGTNNRSGDDNKESHQHASESVLAGQSDSAGRTEEQ